MKIGLGIVLLAIIGTGTAASGKETDSSIDAYKTHIGRLAEVDFRLRANAHPICNTLAPDVGWQLDHAALYGADLATDAPPEIIALAQDGPAAKAGLAVGDRIATVAGKPIGRLLDTRNRELLARSLLDIGSTLPLEEVPVTAHRGDREIRTTLKLTEICSFKTTMVQRKKVDAWSDANNVAVTTGMVGFTENDAELALVLAHELGHILMRQDPDLRRLKGKRKEFAADEIGGRLVVCAGYDLLTAAQFWKRFDSTRPLSFLGSFTHPGSDDRFERLVVLANNVTCPSGRSESSFVDQHTEGKDEDQQVVHR